MSMHGFSLTTGRINKFKGQILGHAMPLECLTRAGRQVRFPKNNSDTYVARRFLPYGALSTNSTTQNTFFGTTTAVDRGNLLAQAHQTAEGVTPTPDSLVPVDVSCVMQQYSCLYGYTDKTANLYEDDIPSEMIKQAGERMTIVNEQVLFGALKACTNVYYGGSGTSRATVNGGLTLNLLRRITQGLAANHAKMVTRVLDASGLYNTEAVAAGYTVYVHTDLEPDIRDLEGFIPAEKYASGTPMANELGKCERFRFITSPDLPSILDGGAAIGATGLYSNLGTSLDVYQLIVMAEDAFSQVGIRGLDSGINPTHLPPGNKDKSDPLGQRGYVGMAWWKATMIENDGWMAVANVGRTSLS